MIAIQETAEFAEWLADLRDDLGKAKILSRIQRLGLGNPGDVAPIGEGISEMRIHFGPGYRVYYTTIAGQYVLLCGGNKRSQPSDVKTAKATARELRKSK
jgi:putative addiction module killer protein